MKKTLLLPLLLLFFFSASSAQAPETVPADAEPLQETFYGITVSDPYRYMENLNSDRVKQWVKEQNRACNRYLDRLKMKSNAKHFLDEYSYAEYKLPHRIGKYYFRMILSKEGGNAALYYHKGLYDSPTLLVNPDEISTKDNITLGAFELSKNSRYVAYQFHRNGSDWAEIQVTNMNGRLLDDHLKHVKFSSISWQGEGFYYSTFKVQDSISALSDEQIYYHKLGDAQEADRLVFYRAKRPSTHISFMVTSDERFLIVTERDEEKGRLNYFIQDAQSPSPALMPFILKPKHALTILDSHEGYIFAVTVLDHANPTLVKIDPNNPLLWTQVLPETEGTLMLDVQLFEKCFVVVYQVGTFQRLAFFSYDGSLAHFETIPEFCALGPLSGNKYDEKLVYYFTSCLFPAVTYTIDLETFRAKLLQTTKITFDYTDYEIREIEYRSKDSVLVPMMIVNKKGLKRNGKNPALLTAYGGFGTSYRASFDPALIYYLEKGGVYAYAKIRGGGEKGYKWHEMGSGAYKQNSFDDFIAAAEYLIRENYTTPQQLAITGGSNGGLVVGAAMTQRPDLFAVAVPEVGVFDMLRFEKFTIGAFHKDEYGSVETEEGFKHLLAYSPLHHIKPGVNYPATLIVTAEDDDRVPPFHSYKFAAALQNNPGQTNPVLLWVEKDAGHYGDQTFDGRLDHAAGLYSFILKYTKVP